MFALGIPYDPILAVVATESQDVATRCCPEPCSPGLRAAICGRQLSVRRDHW